MHAWLVEFTDVEPVDTEGQLHMGEKTKNSKTSGTEIICTGQT
jgi:hypothetical protein